MAGWVDECGEERPSEDELRSILNGFSANIATGFIFAAGYTVALPSAKRMFELGLSTPQPFSVNLPFSVKAGKKIRYEHKDYLMP